MSFSLYPWKEKGGAPSWTNPENGLEWHVDRTLTKLCQEDKHQEWPQLKATAFDLAEIVDGERQYKGSVLLDNTTNAVIAEANSIPAMATRIDLMRFKKSTMKSPELMEAKRHPVWRAHRRNKSTYYMDGKPDRWKLVYYPIFADGRTGEKYDEPRALMQNVDKPGFWHKEVPLRYLKTKKQ